MTGFILLRRKTKKINRDSLVIRVNAEAFTTLDNWSILTGLSKAKVLDKCLDYCKQNLVFIDTDDFEPYENE